MTHPENLTKFKKIFGFSMPVDGMLTMMKKRTTIDLFKLDKEIARRNPDYNPEECTFKGKEKYSIEMVITEVYGKEASDFITTLI